MKVTIHCEGTPKEIAAQLNAAADIYNNTPVGSAAPAEKPAKAKKTTKPAEESFDLASDDAADDAEADDLTEEEEEETEEEETGPGLEEVQAALAKHAKKHDRASAMKILAKYKVKTVKDLKAKDYAAVISAAKK